MPSCATCGGTVAPDGRCWDCGGPQPAFRSHLETTVPAGAAVTDRARRDLNADAATLTVSGPWTIGVVCDGVSMSPRADRAAQVAADTAAHVLASRLAADALPEHALDEAALRASRAVTALAASADAAPACTYVAGIASPEGIWASWIGDSRAYWLPGDGPGMTLTEDDTDARDVLTSWLGANAGEPHPRTRSYRPHGPGTLLLCTDGLWRHLPHPAAYRDRLHGPAPLDDARALVQYALDAGTRDNTTALVIRAG
ncbi:PP2C family protein-serine/threonine phosphatase [Actinomadura bangladeshensis]|uniref:Protein serine/threonine phosphatase 2C family protein n=1 Tax=Actinomadura bangladeshensis TaxID=453573 RepID=A0A4R4MWQ8_9ACTN|nr:protein phosphatase 2C domain-containing protein [Actinomadura bangladeshensis]TDC00691.1 protein serine/threonine phosphatase 2C family protein [Actinomadura bangladeshensis]